MFKIVSLRKCSAYSVNRPVEGAVREARLSAGDDHERTCSLEDVRQMDYLERVIKETLRLLPSVPMIGRQIQETFEHGLSIDVDAS